MERQIQELRHYIKKWIICESAHDAGYELARKNIKLIFNKKRQGRRQFDFKMELKTSSLLVASFMVMKDMILEFPRLTYCHFDIEIVFSKNCKWSDVEKREIKNLMVNGLYDAIDDYTNEKHLDVALVRNNIVVK